MKKIIELNNKITTNIANKWIKCETNYNNAGGLLLEKLIGKERENFPIADYNGIEIKTKYINSKSRITLFSSVPDSFLFENKRLVSLYGYPDKQYPQFKILNMIVSANSRSYVGNGHFFELYVDWTSQKVILQVYKGPFEIIDNLTSWSFELIQEKLNLKLQNLCLIYFEKTFYQNHQYVRYQNPKFYQIKDFQTFIFLIEKGIITISIKLGIYKSGKKFGQLHDHGSSFDIKTEHIDLLYDMILG